MQQAIGRTFARQISSSKQHILQRGLICCADCREAKSRLPFSSVHVSEPVLSMMSFSLPLSVNSSFCDTAGLSELNTDAFFLCPDNQGLQGSPRLCLSDVELQSITLSPPQEAVGWVFWFHVITKHPHRSLSCLYSKELIIYVPLYII